MKLFYQADKARCSDIIPFFDPACGRFRPFYLKRWPPGYQGKDAKPGWYMLDTEDLVHFREHDTGIFGATGCVILHEGVYHMFPCLLTPESQVIRHAVSTDLVSWTEIPEDTFGPDGVIYERDWRDAFVFFHEGEQKWWMLTCASLRDAPTGRKGCIGLCVSEDLHHWEYRPPFYAPGNHQSALECPDLFRIGDWYYLIYSVSSSRYQTIYRRSRNLEGPWEIPPTDTFDTRVFYAGKTASDGRKRYLFGWAASKEFNAKGFNPPSWFGKDYGTFDHGGAMVIHELSQLPDGTLGVSVPESIRQAMREPAPFRFLPLQGSWKQEDSTVSVQAETDYACALMNLLPECFRVEAEISWQGSMREFGLAFQVDREFVKGYYLQLEPDRQRAQWITAIRMHEDGGSTFPYEVELERPLRLEAGKPVRLTVLAEGSLLVINLDGQTAMTVRGFDYSARHLGLYAFGGSAEFRVQQYSFPAGAEEI